MINVSELEKEFCTGCGLCSAVCPVNAISVQTDKSCFMYPKVDEKLCISCGKCAKHCENSKEHSFCEGREFYAFRHKDRDVLKNSSSGGAFTAISDFVLANGGVVYGADYDDNLKVVHKRAASSVERNKMRGSKYVQSDICGIYEDLKKDLESGRLALFVGTPCQCAAVSEFVKLKKAENLILCDLLCDGVGNPSIFGDYLAYLSKRYKSKIKNFKFRDKLRGWEKKTVKIEFENKGDVYQSFMENPMGELYSNHMIHRPSCFKCVHVKENHHSDFTIGDFWSIKDSAPEFFDEKGVSLVIANTKKAKELLSKLECDLLSVSFEDAIKRQDSLNGNIKKSSKNAIVSEEYKKHGSVYVLKKYTNLGFLVRTKRRLKKIIKRARTR